MSVPSVTVRSTSRWVIPPAIASLAWLGLCLWCGYWTWYMVWWVVPPGTLSETSLGLTAIIATMPALLLVTTLIERRRKLAPGSLAWRAIALHCLVCALAGGGVAAALFGRLAWPGHVIGIGAVLLFVAVIDLPAMLLAWLSRFGPGGFDASFRLATMTAATGGLVAALLVWSPATAGLVAVQARLIAGEAPYCLQVNNEMSYRVVNHWDDLSGFRLTTPWRSAGQSISSGEVQWTYHAVLVVERDGKISAYNWSHRALGFVSLPGDPARGDGDISQQAVTLYCRPVPDYLGHLGEHQRAAAPLQHYPPLPSRDSELRRPASPASRPRAALLEPVEPIVPAASWQHAYWSSYLVRYQSMDALIEVCSLAVDVETRRRIREGIEEARHGLQMSQEQARESAAVIVEATTDNAREYCNPLRLYHRDLVAAFPDEDRPKPP